MSDKEMHTISSRKPTVTPNAIEMSTPPPLIILYFVFHIVPAVNCLQGTSHICVNQEMLKRRLFGTLIWHAYTGIERLALFPNVSVSPDKRQRLFTGQQLLG